MQRPPRRPTPTKRAQPRALQGAAASAVPAAAVSSTESGSSLAEELISQFEDVLNQDADLDAVAKDFLKRQFSDALVDAERSEAGPPPRSEWLETVEALQNMGALKEEDGRALIRQLDEAVQPLQKRDVKLALELSRRIDQDGQESALEWYRAQTGESEENEDSAGVGSSPCLPARPDAITRSKSRRLRGPPGG